MLCGLSVNRRTCVIEIESFHAGKKGREFEIVDELHT